MRGYPSAETVERIQKQYPKGTRVELVRMDDIQAPPIGTHGTVTGVDSIGSLLMKWDNGGSLNVAYGEDIVRKLDSVTVTCYGETKVWDDREEAARFYAEAVAETDGSERERYALILSGITAGEKEVSDMP